VIVITQKGRDPHTHRVAARQPFPVSVVHALHEEVGGYPLWDVCAEARQVWPMVRGQYVTFNHQEFLHCPHRLEYTLDYLELTRPTLALGNLRRFGRFIGEHFYQTDRGRPESDAVTERLRRRAGYLAAAEAEMAPTVHWLYWEPAQQPGECPFIEDLFFARRDWLEDFQILGHAEDLIFQDVYDLLGAAWERLGRHGLQPDCVRLDLDTHKALHLWHPCEFTSFRADVRDWFLSQPERWGRTAFARADLWDRLVGRNGHSGWTRDEHAVWCFRRGRGGTVSRYVQGLDRWLKTPAGQAQARRATP